MTIRKGEEWGTRIEVPARYTVAEDDADLALCAPGEAVATLRGDLHRALGQPGLPVPGGECTLVTIDALRCTVTMRNGVVEERMASSHVAFGSWWSGRHVVVSNSGFLDGLNIAPRSHPNDGEADVLVLEAEMSLRQRLIARRRARTGTHTPHPHVTIRRSTGFGHTKSHRRERLSLDGRAVPEWEHIEITVVPDYWSVLL